MTQTLLSIKGLVTGFDTDEGHVTAVDGISIDVQAGETLGIVGESGCGKSVTALSIMRLLPQPMGQIASGEIHFEGKDLVQLPLAEMEKVRGGRIGMVFQEPMTALNPVHTIGKQLGEGILRRHGQQPPDRFGETEARQRRTTRQRQQSGGGAKAHNRSAMIDQYVSPAFAKATMTNDAKLPIASI